ncbi:trypsin-like peptidase domain-containing protein [Botrimarina mediterranea]
MLLGVVVSVCPLSAWAQTVGEGAAAALALESSLVDLIERSERSVVSITRHTESPELVAGAAQQPGGVAIGGGVVRGNGLPFGQQAGQPRFFIQGQPLIAGRLGNLQMVTDAATPPSGAGVVIDPSGIVLTQFAVVGLDDHHVVTTPDGVRYLADLRAADGRSGLAVLAIRKRLEAGQAGDDGAAPEAIDLPALPIGKAEDLRKGRLVVSIGNPYAIESDGQPTASWGSITNTAARVPQNEPLGGEVESDGQFRTTLHHFGSLIQTDARLGWNASGGALVNLAGELVGITTTASTIAGHEQPAGYAIPLNAAMRRAVETMRDGMAPEYGLLGVSFDRVASRNAKTGRMGIGVRDSYRGAPAQVAGLLPGDLLLEVNGKSIKSPDALQLAVGSLPPGAATDIVYERQGQLHNTSVVLGKAYLDGGDQIISAEMPSWRGIRVDYPTAVPPEVLRVKTAEGAIDPEGCVVVSEVEEGSVSWESGVRPYAFISHVGGKRVRSPEEFFDAVRDASANVNLKFTRPLNTKAPASFAE